MTLSRRHVVGMALVAPIMVVAAIGGPQRLRAYVQGDRGCASSTRVPMPDTVEQARTAMLCLINRERAAHGLPALVTDVRLTREAQLHADDMGRRNFYEPGNGLPRITARDRARLDEQPGTSQEHPP